MLEHYLLLWLCLSSFLAFHWPAEFASNFVRSEYLPDLIEPFLSDPFYNGVSTLSYVIAITMFCIGWLLPKEEVLELARKWPSVLIGTVAQYASMPLLAFLIANTLPMSDDHRIGIVMVGCVPGAMASNVLTMMARGNVSYSVSLTTLATLISPILVPWLLYYMLSGEKIDVPDQFWFLMLTVVSPTLVGHLCGRSNSIVRNRFETLAKTVASLAILWIISVVVGRNRERLGNGTSTIIFAVLFLNLSGYAVGIFVGRLFKMERGMSRALTLEIGMQNAGLGSTMAAAMFVDRPEVMIPTAFYTFCCMLTGTILARFWMQFNLHSR